MTLHEIVSIGEAGAHEDVFTAAKNQELADTLVEFSKLAIWPTPKTSKIVHLHLCDSKLVVLHKLVVEVNVCLEQKDLSLIQLSWISLVKERATTMRGGSSR